MSRTLTAFILSAATLLPAAATAQSEGGTWTLRQASPREQAGGRGHVHVALRAPGLNTFYTPLHRFTGLTPGVFDGTRTDVTFTLSEDAGTFHFTGSFTNGQGRGSFTFEPSAQFAAELRRKGHGEATTEQLFSMARHGIGRDFLVALEQSGYAKPTVQEMTDAGVNGADAEYVRELHSAGQRVPDLETLRRLRAHSISGGMIRELRALGYTNLTADELVQLRNQRLDAATSPVDGTPLAGRFRVHGASGSFRDLELFWDDNTNWRRWVRLDDLRGMPAAGFAGGASPVSFRMEQDAGVFAFEGEIQGERASGTFSFTPKRDYGERLQALGIQVTRALRDHDLKNLAWGGMSLADAQQLAAMGFEKLTERELLDMSIFQVTPAYVRAMRAAGVQDITSSRVAVDLKHGGITPEFVQQLHTADQRSFTACEVLSRREARSRERRRSRAP